MATTIILVLLLVALLIATIINFLTMAVLNQQHDELRGNHNALVTIVLSQHGLLQEKLPESISGYEPDEDYFDVEEE